MRISIKAEITENLRKLGILFSQQHLLLDHLAMPAQLNTLELSILAALMNKCTFRTQYNASCILLFTILIVIGYTLFLVYIGTLVLLNECVKHEKKNKCWSLVKRKK